MLTALKQVLKDVAGSMGSSSLRHLKPLKMKDMTPKNMEAAIHPQLQALSAALNSAHLTSRKAKKMRTAASRKRNM